jgi:hypothetical protein
MGNQCSGSNLGINMTDNYGGKLDIPPGVNSLIFKSGGLFAGIGDYNFVFWCRIASGETLNFEIIDSSNEIIYVDNNYVGTDYTWRKIEIPLSIIVETGGLEFQFISLWGIGNTNYIFIDDVSCWNISNTINLVVNGSFETDEWWSYAQASREINAGRHYYLDIQNCTHAQTASNINFITYNIKKCYNVFIQKIIQIISIFNKTITRPTELQQSVKGIVNVNLESNQVDIVQKEIKETTYI